MKLQIKNDVNKDKPLAIIGFSKVEIYHLMTLWNLEPKMVERYLDAWDFTIQPVYHFQDHEQNHFFFYLSDKEYDDKLFLNAIGEFINAANQKQLSALQILFSEPNDMNLLLSLTAKQVFLADYSFDKYKAKKRKPMLQEIQIILPSAFPQSEAIIQESKTIAEAVALARDLVNEPSNVIYPQTLADTAIKIGNEAGFDVLALDKNEIENLQMHAFLSVAKGSEKPPRLIVMKYLGNPEKPDEILGLIGKGLTYDSGGYSIKTTEGMFTMKADMAGAASVIGAMFAISKQKLKCNVIAVVAACENLISGGAYKPGEVISSMSGKTIEIGNTDAEGRLTLIDALVYAIQEQNATKVVDVATLTGAVVVGLGNVRTGVISNNDSFYQDLEKASQLSLERIWRLPHDDEYQDLLKSEIADISNTGGRMAGTITAGLFIKSFLPKDIPWLHLDIAGTAYQTKKTNQTPHGATGVPVSSLYNLAKIHSEK